MAPARTSSVTWFSRNRARPFAAAPSWHQACGTSHIVAGSAAPLTARTKTSRPAVRQLSMMRRGSPPPPAMIPSLPAIRSFRLTNGPARIGSDELDDVVDRSNAAKTFSSFVDPIDKGAVSGEQELIGIAQPLNVLTTEAAALHADDVEPVQPGSIPHHLAIGDDVPLDTRHPADHRIILNDDMTRERRVVRHDNVVADLAVMGDVGADHEQAVIADPGDHSSACGARVHRHVFADRVVATDDKFRFLAPVLEVLRFKPDRGERK